MKKLFLLSIILFSCQFIPTLDYKSLQLSSNLIADSGCLTLDTIITDNAFLKKPHDAIVDLYDQDYAYVSGKGSSLNTTTDGSFAVVHLPTKSVIGGYSGHADQSDGETVLQLSPNRVLHFVKNKVLLFDVSDKSTPQKIRTVNHTNGVGNGAVQIGDYVFSANKGNYIDVFNVGDIDNFYLVGRYGNTFDSNLKGWHDVDGYGDYIITVKRNGVLAKIKVFENGVFLPIANWIRQDVKHANNNDANRVRVQGDYAIVHSGDYVSTVDISGTPVYVSGFYQGEFSAGSAFYNGLVVAPYGVGIRLLDISNPVSITEVCNFYNDIDFSIGNNTNFHDSPVVTIGGEDFILVTVQNANKVAFVRINLCNLPINEY